MTAEVAEPPPKVLPWNYRTVPCSFFERGLCKNGTDCTFIHNETPGAPRAPRLLCRFFEKGVCKLGDKCIFSHDADTKETEIDKETNEMNSHLMPNVCQRNYRTLPCKFFPLGMCCKGSDCNFIHELEAPLEAAATKEPPTAATGAEDAQAAMSDRATDVPMTSDESADESEGSTSAPIPAPLLGTQAPHPRRREYGPPPEWLPPGVPAAHPCPLHARRQAPPVEQLAREWLLAREVEKAQARSMPSALHALPPWRCAPKVSVLVQENIQHQEQSLEDSDEVIGEGRRKPLPSWRHRQDDVAHEAASELNACDASALAPDRAESSTMVQVHVWTGERWRSEIWDLETIEIEIARDNKIEKSKHGT